MPSRYEFYPESNYDPGSDQQIYGAIWIAQTFTPSTSHAIAFVKLYTGRLGNPGTLTVSIKATDGSSKPTGDDLAVGTLDADAILTSYAHNTITFTAPYFLTASIKYAIVCRAISGDNSNYVLWGYDGSSASYSGGGEVVSGNSGSTWGSEEANIDEIFEEWGANPGELAGVYAIVEERFHYVDAYGFERFIQGTIV